MHRRMAGLVFVCACLCAGQITLQAQEFGESAMFAVKKWIYASGHSRTIAEVSIDFDSRR